jgi:flagellar hook-associated protein 3 FlgL
MRTAWISTASLMNTPRAGVQRMQTEMMRLSREMSTGRMSDVGLNFGAATGRNVTLHVDLDSLSGLIASANAGSTRLELTQAALNEMRDGATSFLEALMSAGDANGSVTTLRQTADSALAGFITNANASGGHDYLFGGINASVPPLADYAGSPAAAAVDAAFLAKFGVTQDDPAAAAITATDMADFLANEFATLFDDPAWGGTWSAAADQPLATRLGPTDAVDSSVSANQPAMRKLAMVYSMVGALGIERLGAAARQVVVDNARSLAGQAIGDLVNLQADVGANQNWLNDAVDRLTLEKEITERHLSALESVDVAEAKVHFDTLSTEVEMSYSLTARLLRLSLLNYA